LFGELQDREIHPLLSSLLREQLFHAGQVSWRQRRDLLDMNNCSESPSRQQDKKKEQENQNPLFLLLQLNKGLFKCLILYYIATVTNYYKRIKKLI